MGQYALVGVTWFRHGEIANKATRELTDVISIKTLNANASKGEVTVSGKNFKFSARSVKRQSFAV